MRHAENMGSGEASEHMLAVTMILALVRCNTTKHTRTSLAPVPHRACTISSTVCVVGARFCIHKHLKPDCVGCHDLPPSSGTSLQHMGTYCTAYGKSRYVVLSMHTFAGAQAGRITYMILQA